MITWDATRQTSPKPTPFYLLRSYRRLEPTEYNLYRGVHARMTWEQVPRHVILRRFLGWFYRFPRDFLRNILKYGRRTRLAQGRSIAGQVFDMLMLANAANILPADYYDFGLARFSGGPALNNYISTRMHHVASTFCIRSRMAGNADTIDFLDKSSFERHCRDRGIAHAETVAIADNGSLTDFAGLALARPPDADLFVKPNRGGRGVGARRYLNIGPGRFCAVDGTALSAARLCGELARLSKGEDGTLLVQKVLENSPEIAAMAGRTLATVRIITLEDESGEPEAVFACLRTAGSADAIVDNYHAAGIAFAVDVASGTLAPGRRLHFSDDPRFHSEHPVTGAPMAGRHLPGFDTALKMAVTLHRSVPDLLLAGWDIALTPRGPRVVEANVPPGLPVVQMNSGFLGTRYSRLLAHHVRSYLEKSEPRASRWLVGADLAPPR